jgi:hypothetical protein
VQRPPKCASLPLIHFRRRVGTLLALPDSGREVARQQRGSVMKFIIAIIKPFKLDEVAKPSARSAWRA